MQTNRVQSAQVGQVERLGKLPRVHRARPDVAHLTRLHRIVQRFQSLLNRRLVVPAVNLVKVHVIGFQPFQALIQLKQDRFARQPPPVGLLAHRAVHLGGDHYRLAPHVRLQEIAQHPLAVPA